MSEICPCCEKHCPSDALHCPKGMAHFGMSIEHNSEVHSGDVHGIEPVTAQERVVLLLRQCGHYLHHSAGYGGFSASEKLPGCLSEKEAQALAELLQKYLQSWQE